MKLSIRKKVDVLYDALWIYKNAGDPAFEKVAAGWTKKTLLGRYLYCFVLFFKKIMQVKRTKFYDFNAKTLLYVNSKNTKHALAPLEDLGLCFSQVSTVKSVKSTQALSIVAVYNYSLFVLLQLPVAFILYIYKNPKFALQYPDFFLENWGKLEWNLSFLHKQKQLNNVIFANDHNVQNRLFLHACKMQAIYTSYIQHAPITEYFPPLSFDCSFLYGKIDYDKYNAIDAVSTKTVLVGIPAFDQYINSRRKIEKVNVVGVSFNILDDVEKVKNIANYIVSELRVKVVIRPHPRDIRVISFNNELISYSDAKKEDSFTYLQKIDMHISGDSGIHLDSALMNVPSFYYRMANGGLVDYYGFVKNRMIDSIEKYQDIDLYINKMAKGKYDCFYLRSKGYCASIGSDWDGKVVKHIKEILKNDLKAGL
jgi:hypothetical protein